METRLSKVERVKGRGGEEKKGSLEDSDHCSKYPKRRAIARLGELSLLLLYLHLNLVFGLKFVC